MTSAFLSSVFGAVSAIVLRGGHAAAFCGNTLTEAPRSVLSCSLRSSVPFLAACASDPQLSLERMDVSVIVSLLVPHLAHLSTSFSCLKHFLTVFIIVSIAVCNSVEFSHKIMDTFFFLILLGLFSCCIMLKSSWFFPVDLALFHSVSL